MIRARCILRGGRTGWLLLMGALLLAPAAVHADEQDSVRPSIFLIRPSVGELVNFGPAGGPQVFRVEMGDSLLLSEGHAARDVLTGLRYGGRGSCVDISACGGSA